MKPPDFYQHRLDAVSRSFALCIPQLERPFRDQVALAYLLLRVLDTVEDAPFTDKHLQQRQFRRFREFLQAMPSEREVRAFIAAFPQQISDGERSLLLDTRTLLTDGHELAPAPRAVMFRTIDRMAEGMAAYARRASPLRLVDLEDVARYCCFVAGVVGEMLTELWALLRRESPPRPALAYHFGVFLQKVNILKDQREDEAAGRFLVPNRGELLASLARDSDRALAYLQSLPASDRGYRTFCAWSLMMGAATIRHVSDLALKPRTSHRDETAELLARTAAIAHDNTALGEQLAALMPRLPEVITRAPLAKPESHAWFRRALDAQLTDGELHDLGIVGDRAAALAG